RYWRDWSSDVCSSDLLSRTPGERGLEKAKTSFFSCSLPPLPGEGRAAGEEGRGGEGPGGAAPAGLEKPYGSERGSHQNNNRVKKKSEIKIAIDATTTAAVVERPTPSAPPVV